jgi:cellulose synthase/poly-beta-1,6-N-acetylglucosamine synthase-like glycosyltransferase
LDWRTTSGLIAEDMELCLRTNLERIPIDYAPDLKVYNDVTSDAASVHQQRLRWNATYPPLLDRYSWPLIKQRRLDALFGMLWIPAFANLFLYLVITTAALAALSWKLPALAPYALAAGLLWLAHVLYFLTAFHLMKERLTWRDFAGFAAHLAIRAFALVQAVFWVRVKDWRPAPHSEDDA